MYVYRNKMYRTYIDLYLIFETPKNNLTKFFKQTIVYAYSVTTKWVSIEKY